MTRNQILNIFKYVSLAGIYGGLLMPLVFVPTVIFPFVFSKLVFFQALVGLTFPAYVALAWMEPKYRPRKHLLYFGILAYFAAMALSVIFAADPFRAWWGNQERMNGLFTLLHFLAWLTMSVGVIKKWEEWRVILNYQIILSGGMAIVSILQKLNPNLLMFPAGERVGGLLDNPIYMAAYQIFNLFFIGLLAWKVKDRRWWWFYGSVAALDIIAFFLAQSRGGLFGLGVGIVAFALFIGAFHKDKKVKRGIFSVVGILLVSYGFLFAFRDADFVRNSPFRRYVNLRATLNTRLIAWDVGWTGFLERPLTGWGLDNYHYAFNKNYHPESLRYGQYETWFDRAHNTVLDVLSMTGLIGFIAFVSIFAALFWSVIRAYKKGWIDLPIAAILFSLPIAYFFQNLLVFDHPAGFSMSYLMYALIISATQGEFIGKREDAPEEGEPKTKLHSAPWAAFVVLQLLMIALVWRTSILPFKASQLSIQSNQFINSDLGGALDLMKEANGYWTPYTDEQAFLLSRNLVALVNREGFADDPRWREAYDFAKQLNEHELAIHPKNTHTLFTAGRLVHAFAVKLVPEDRELAHQLYLDAIDSSPLRQQLHYALAQFYAETGEADALLDVMKRVRDFDLDLGEGHWRYGLTLIYERGEFEEGAREVILSQTVPYPYKLQQDREMLPIVDAYLLLDDLDAIDGFISRFDSLPKGSASVYAQIALKLRLAERPDLERKVAEYARTVYPTFEIDYENFVKRYEENQAGGEERVLRAATSTE